MKEIDSPYHDPILTEHLVFQTGEHYDDKILELKKLIFLGTLPVLCFSKSIVKSEHLQLIGNSNRQKSREL